MVAASYDRTSRTRGGIRVEVYRVTGAGQLFVPEVPAWEALAFRRFQREREAETSYPKTV